MVVLLALIFREVGRAAYKLATFGSDTADLSGDFIFSRSGVHAPLRAGHTTMILMNILSLSFGFKWSKQC